MKCMMYYRRACGAAKWVNHRGQRSPELGFAAPAPLFVRAASAA